MEYSVFYDVDTDEYIATAGDYEYSADCALLAYAWLASQILDDEDES